MLISSTAEYKERLIALWEKTFGDERDYIELLFPEGNCLCDIFVKTEGETVCSVLYLLNCNLTYGGKVYKGKYLYAAATDERYRKRGLMAELIKEAQCHCKQQGFDFISLVPANEGLYSYYEKFGFCCAMHRYKTTLNCDGTVKSESLYISGTDYFNKRKSCCDNGIHFTDKSLDYAVACLEYSGCRFVESLKNSLYVTNAENNIEELIFCSENLKETLGLLKSSFSGEIKIHSPYDLSLYGKSEAEKFGMLCPINEELKREWKFTDIYMNIALD